MASELVSSLEPIPLFSAVNTDHEISEAGYILMMMSSVDPWKIKKVLKKSDVNGLSRLLLPIMPVTDHILRTMDPLQAQLCQKSTGKKLDVFDVDDCSWHNLVLKQWDTNGYFVLTGNWIRNFVSRKRLEAGDEIGLAWANGHIFFKLLRKKEN